MTPPGVSAALQKGMIALQEGVIALQEGVMALQEDPRILRWSALKGKTTVAQYKQKVRMRAPGLQQAMPSSHLLRGAKS